MAEVIRRNEPHPSDANAWFFKETSLEELLARTPPLESIDDLALDDLTPEEARAFLDAVEE